MRRLINVLLFLLPTIISDRYVAFRQDGHSFTITRDLSNDDESSNQPSCSDTKGEGECLHSSDCSSLMFEDEPPEEKSEPSSSETEKSTLCNLNKDP